ncbi:MAG: TetR/AcrR family transcriptional regulator [Acidobacteriota bacterium]|nr:TetR/AcrR family transcriptional regulator [Acidobacteriota bacterium]
MKKRLYTKKLRAESEDATRQRIVEALVELHEEIGPAQTTISAVAERAGVQRLTVYRHFPDEPSMIRACSAHWAQLNPLPDLAPSHDEPLRACRTTLLRLYGWYRGNAGMLTQITRDAERLPVVAEALAPFGEQLDRVAEQLDRYWNERSSHRRATLRHALEFSTWRSLDRITGSDRRSVAIVAGWL